MNAHGLFACGLAGGLFVLAADSAQAQVRAQWINEFSRVGEDVGFYVAQDSQRNVVTTGWTENETTDFDVFVSKYDRTGRLLWTQIYDGDDSLYDAPSGILIDASDNVYVCGVTTTAGGYDYLLLKYDSNGALLWDETYGGAGNGDDWVSGAGSFDLDQFGNIYLTGYALAADGVYEFATRKYGPNGGVIWTRTYRGPNLASPDSYGWTLEVAPSGAVYVGGDAANPSGSRDYTLLKYDADGTLVWDRQFDGVYGLSESLYDLDVDLNENIVLTGTSRTSGGFEYCVAKFDASGQFLWEGRHGGTAGYHYGWQVDTDAGGNSFVTGASTTSGGEYDIVTVKFNPNGVREWSQTYRHPFYFGDDWGYGVVVGPDGNIYVTGYMWSYFGDGFEAVTFKYDPSGALLWDTVYGGYDRGGNDAGFGLLVDDDLNIYVAGVSGQGDFGADAVLIRYTQGPAPSLDVVPDPLIAGQNATFTVTNFEPETRTYLGYSLVGEGNVFVPFLNVSFQIAQPLQAGLPRDTDATGSVSWTLPVPANSGGTNVWLQAAQYNQATNVVATIVQ